MEDKIKKIFDNLGENDSLQIAFVNNIWIVSCNFYDAKGKKMYHAYKGENISKCIDCFINNANVYKIKK